MAIKKHIPNLFTLLNLLAGTIAVIYAVQNELLWATLFVFIGVFFDFFDGFIARLLKIQGELGKQLDSLADMVTSGVVPGIVLFQLLQEDPVVLQINKTSLSWDTQETSLLPYVGLLFTLAAAYRLATFNLDERQSATFIGLPAPAATLVVLSIPLIMTYGTNHELTMLLTEDWVLILLTVLLSVLMNVNIPMFSLKFNGFSWQKNKIKYVFLAVALLAILTLNYYAIPIVVLVYIAISVGKKLLKMN
jgi:CDP-diacylglycerol--serine O-phosphatidyltransferase